MDFLSITDIKDYTIRDRISHGAYSIVYKATHNLSKYNVAVKVIDKSKLNSVEIKRMHSESEILADSLHKNIIELFEVIATDSFLFIFTELSIQGPLSDYVYQHGICSDSIAKKYFHQLIDALCYLHHKQICHRDIKSDNIVLQNKLTIKIIDFGLSKYLIGGKTETICGSVDYMAPEFYLKGSYNFKVDIWASGVLLYYMTTGNLPFDQSNKKEKINQIKKAKYETPFLTCPLISELVQNTLIINDTERLSAQQILTMFKKSISPKSNKISYPNESHVRNVLEVLSSHFIDIDLLKSDLKSNQHTSLTCNYNLLLKKRRKMPSKAFLKEYLNLSTESDKYSPEIKKKRLNENEGEELSQSDSEKLKVNDLANDFLEHFHSNITSNSNNEHHLNNSSDIHHFTKSHRFKSLNSLSKIAKLFKPKND